MRITSSAAWLVRIGFAGAALVTVAASAHADPRADVCGNVDYNAMLLRIIEGLPNGGGYSLNAKTVEMPTVTAHNIGAGNWELRVYDGHPSHCTGAAYALFTHLVAKLHNGGAIHLGARALASLEVTRTTPDGTARLDGEGPFGIFNSNGAGVAAFLKHTGTGFSFRDDKLEFARAGDFLKLFWNGNVGATEQGHQVVYTGHRTIAGRDMVCFWGSQRQNRKRRGGRTEALYFPASATAKVHDGYGEVCRPRGDIKQMIFSRVTCMAHLSAGLESMAKKAGGPPDLFVDEYLRSISSKSSDHATLNRAYDILPAPASFADSGMAPQQ